MTTIAYKDGVIAADSQLTIGDVKLLSDDKIKILNKDTIFAAAGDVTAIIQAEKYFALPDWEEKFDARPNLLEKDKDGEYEWTIDAILISKGRVFVVDRFLVPEPVRHPFIACGTGWKFALAAMQFGLSAPDAVKFASEFDINTNNRIRYLNVSEVFPAKKAKTTRGRGTKSVQTSMAPEEKASGEPTTEGNRG